MMYVRVALKVSLNSTVEAATRVLCMYVHVHLCMYMQNKHSNSNAYHMYLYTLHCAGYFICFPFFCLQHSAEYQHILDGDLNNLLIQVKDNGKTNSIRSIKPGSEWKSSVHTYTKPLSWTKRCLSLILLDC